MDFARRIVEFYQNQGYRLVEELAPYRFYVAILEKEGQKYFLKTGQKSASFFRNKPLDEMWAREEKLISFVNSRLENSHPKPPFRLAKVIDRGQDEEAAWALFEYLPGDHIIDGNQHPLTEEETRWLPTVVKILGWFDDLDAGELGTLDRDLVQENIEKITEWSKTPLEKGILNESEVNQALATIHELGPTASTRLQHGDFVPWHMHDDGFPNVVLIDLEGMRPRFRYYDLAYVYHRLYTKRAAPQLARDLLNLFLDTIEDKSQFAKQFQLPLVNRAIGGLQDYCNELPRRTEDSNREHLRLQRQFLEDVFSGKITQ